VIDTVPRLSFGREIGDAERVATFAVVRIAAFESPETTLSMAIPKTWKALPNSESRRPGWIELKSFIGSDSVSAHVFQSRQEYEVDLRDWLEYQAGLLSMTLTALEPGKTEYGPMLHAAATGKDGDRFRLVVAGDGPDLFFQMGRAAAGEPAKTDEILGLIAASFFFETHTGRVTREDVNVYVAGNRKYQLAYPSSWNVEPRADKPAAVDFRVASPDDTLAYASVALDAGKPQGAAGLRASLENAISELEDVGVTIQKLERIPADEYGGVDERWRGTAQFPAGQGQVMFLFRKGDPGWISAILVAPSKDRNPLLWMRARRFYEFLSETLESPATIAE
jgi:hypothetical protein